MAIKITRQTVTAPVRKLNATWQMEKPQTLKQTMSDEIEQMIQEEIDAEILAKLYKTDGWYLVPRHEPNSWDPDTVKPWLKEHCPSGGYHVWSSGCLFRDREMSVEFELTWS